MGFEIGVAEVPVRYKVDRRHGQVRLGRIRGKLQSTLRCLFLWPEGSSWVQKIARSAFPVIVGKPRPCICIVRLNLGRSPEVRSRVPHVAEPKVLTTKIGVVRLRIDIALGCGNRRGTVQLFRDFLSRFLGKRRVA